MVTLEAKLAFRHDNGQFNITTRLTTKMVSPDKDRRKDLYDAIKNVLEPLCEEAWSMKKEWHEANEDDDPDQLTLFADEFGPDNDDADNGPDDENGDIDESAMSLSLNDTPAQKRGRK